jgi:hypothetical protein
MKTIRLLRLASTAGLILPLLPIAASGAELDLRTAGSSGTINGGFFTTSDPRSTGSGVIDSFVRLSNSGFEQGYNATARPVMPDVNTSPTFTHDIQLSSIPVVVNPTGAAPGSYYEFLLDVNQNSSDPYLTLYSLRFYTNPSALTMAATLADLTGAAGTTLRWNLDSGSDSRIHLNYDLGSGSGSGDLYALIPITAFAGADSSHYLYLYSAFGTEPSGSGTYYASNDGYEEWAVRGTSTPPPPSVPDGGNSLALLGVGLIGVEAARRRLLGGSLRPSGRGSAAPPAAA